MWHRALTISAFCGCVAASAAVDAAPILLPCGVGGKITETTIAKKKNDGTVKDVRVRFFATDKMGALIDKTPATTVVDPVVEKILPSGQKTVGTIPGKVAGTEVCDATNTYNYINSPDGEEAILSLESLVFDTTTGEWLIEGLFARLGSRELVVPDLFADTDGNGVLGAGDVLYSLVDINQYLTSVPLFALGDVFNIQNGQVLGLPGMLFSLTPFLYNPTSAAGFDYTPYSGIGVADASHGLAPIPEPATLTLSALGGVALCIYRRRRRPD